MRGGGDYTTIQDALDGADAGDTIVVCPGTYAENLRIDQPVEIVGETSAADVTIDAGGSGTVVSVDTAGTVSLRQLTLTGGEYGAVESSLADLSLTEVAVVDNDSAVATVSQSNGSLVVSDARFVGNTSAGTAGILSDSADVTIERVLFTGNTESVDGAKLLFIGDGGDLVMRNVLAYDNDIRLLYDVRSEHAEVTFVTTEVETVADAKAFMIYELCELTLENNIFFAETYNPLALDDYSSATPVVLYNDFWYVGRINIDGSDRFPATSYYVDPGFVDARGGDYHLTERSECVDAGDPDDSFDDLDGTRSDLGAYGGPDGDW